ncbi:MAG: 4Fe-4S dicluster domain-containing protein [Lachnospiraceae bacterium]|nr:4Fe-4S dicluster domain-containing protein [Lachnospiraceae bacterium]
METLKDYLEGAYRIRKIPTYIADRCTERKSTGHACQVCADICPQNIYPTGKRKRPIWDQCLKCGICSASCPSRCITVPSRKMESFLMAAARKGRLTIACENEGSGAKLSESCIAAVSWEQLAYAALREGVVISLRACGECSYETCKEVIEQNLNELRFFLGEEVYQERVTVLRAGEEYEAPAEEEAMSRRELFGFFSNLSVDTAFTMMPKIDNARDNGLLFRAMLRDAVAQKAADCEPADRPKYAVRLPHFTQNCYNCGYCVSACPNDALKFVQGENGFTVAVDVWKCTGCNLCKLRCRADGISGIVPMRVSTLGRVAVAKLPNHLCAVCGKPFPYGSDGDICKSCQAKKRNEAFKKRREERKLKRALEAEAAALAVTQEQSLEAEESELEQQAMEAEETVAEPQVVEAEKSAVKPQNAETELSSEDEE